VSALLSALEPRAVRAALQGPSGLRVRTGPITSRITTRLPEVVNAIQTLYADYPVEGPDAFVDFHVGVRRPSSLRALWRKQVVFDLDGQAPFNPLPGDQGFPLLEWGLNWCAYAHCHQYLILHAAVLERGGRALILPAPSGSGKSTLCAGLLFNGWRLLSDELTLIDPRDGTIVPIPRPVSVKNASIDVLSRFVPSLRFGSRVSETVKGVVAHFKAPADAVARAGEKALPAWVVMPKYVAGLPATLTPQPKARAFMGLIENAFNYDVFGADGFALLGSVIDRCACFTFEYGHLPEAIVRFAQLAQQGQQAQAPTADRQATS
jgi:HprK-related kinase A